MTLNGKSRFAAIWLMVTGLCGYFEFQRLMLARDSPAGWFAWFVEWDPETTLPFLVLLALPVFFQISGSSTRTGGETERQPKAALRTRLLCCGLVFGVSLAASSIVGLQSVKLSDGVQQETIAFYELPPAYHDEYSYLLQAKTFAAGKLSWPPAKVRPDLFHQVHVLNEHRTASRYFPWTGLWIAIFLDTGQPIIGHWLAGALAATFCYLCAAEFLRPGAALTAGLLIGCSPGLAVFSNLLLGHHPTLMALSVFLWAMIRLMRRPTVTLTLISGTALTLAMLGRPMTAAGFALPWGISFIWRIICCTEPVWIRQRIYLLASMAIPLVVGFMVLGVLNHSITGSFFRSAYQEYTDVYAPRHTYGFNNGIRGDAKQTSKVLQSYDRWAENLTWPLAMRNVGNRCLASAQWSLGIVPIVIGLASALLRLLFPPEGAQYQTRILRLIFASVVTLHLVHVPYWFSGIMHWHYVFETAPLILILVSAGLSSVAGELRRLTSAPLFCGWVICFLASAILPGWLTMDSTWGPSKIAAATSELAWSRRQFEVFHRKVASKLVTKPALVLVEEPESGPPLSYIINDPEYRNEVLIARVPETKDEICLLKKEFPDRHFYRFVPQSFALTPITVD